MNEYNYVSSDGTITPVSKMQNSHLLNSLIKLAIKNALRENTGDEPYVKEIEAVSALKAEVLRRMPIQ